jgi:hypothetical protein
MMELANTSIPLCDKVEPFEQAMTIVIMPRNAALYVSRCVQQMTWSDNSYGRSPT